MFLMIALRLQALCQIRCPTSLFNVVNRHSVLSPRDSAILHGLLSFPTISALALLPWPLTRHNSSTSNPGSPSVLVFNGTLFCRKYTALYHKWPTTGYANMDEVWCPHGMGSERAAGVAMK